MTHQPQVSQTSFNKAMSQVLWEATTEEDRIEKNLPTPKIKVTAHFPYKSISFRRFNDGFPLFDIFEIGFAFEDRGEALLQFRVTKAVASLDLEFEFKERNWIGFKNRPDAVSLNL